MSLADKSNTYTGVGVGASGVGSLVSILAFALPYWIYYDEDLTLSDGTGSYQVQWTYYYGLWKYCNKVSSDVSNSDRCGSVETHSDVEQTTAALLLLANLLFVSGVLNCVLYLTIFKKEKLCLYIAWISVVVAGVLALTSIVIFARTDHSINVTNSITLNFSASKLHASFWLVVVGCLMVAIATVFLTLAIINIHRTEGRSDDKKSMISYDSVNKSKSTLIGDDDSIPEEYEYKLPKIPEEYPYTESPYSTSSESLSGLDDSCDSDDSDIDPKFAKLKTKITPKPTDVKNAKDDPLEVRRCKSGEPITMVGLDDSSQPKSAVSNLRSRSASALTPVERSDDIPYFIAEKLRVNLDIDFDSNPLYMDNVQDMEPSKAPVATNLIVTLPPPANDDAFILRRSKTDMPFTQRMRDTIGLKHKEPLKNEELSVHKPAEENQEGVSPSVALKTKPFLKKPHKSKSKPKKPSEEQLRRERELYGVYATPPPIKPFFPGQDSQKPAPWSKVRSKAVLRPKTSKMFQWSLLAYGADSVPKLSQHLKSAKKKHHTPVSKDDEESEDENTSKA